MNYRTFTRIAGHLGIPADKCKYDPDKGLFSFKSGEIRVTGNHYSDSVSVKNLRTGVVMQANGAALLKGVR